jgi:hypothetical protein
VSLVARARRSIDVVSPAFEGKSAVDRQRMVYKAIWQELQARLSCPRARPFVVVARVRVCMRLLTPGCLFMCSAVCLPRIQEAVHAVDAMTTRTPVEAGR